jgi:hypothetical protein
MRRIAATPAMATKYWAAMSSSRRMTTVATVNESFSPAVEFAEPRRAGMLER